MEVFVALGNLSGELLFALALSLILTLFFEVCFFLAVTKRNTKDLLLVVLVNVLTNPVVVLIYWLVVLYTGMNRTLIKIPLELFAFLIEGFYYKKYGQQFARPFLFSLAANVFSFTMGLPLQLINCSG